MYKKLFTSESVSNGHPDKIADQIADAILDQVIATDNQARAAIEVTVSTGDVSIFGELTTNSYVDVRDVAVNKIKEIGYDKPELGFSYDSVNVSNRIVEQSKEISQAVDATDYLDIGAGDQGIVFGYATNENPQYIPTALLLSHQLMKRQRDVRRDNLKYLRPDAKSQITVELDDDSTVKRVDTILFSTQHDEQIEIAQLKEDVFQSIIKPVIPKDLIDDQTKIIINPSGSFILGGPQADSGLTGRKIIVDTYGGAARHGGGAFSGKDATKIDRSAAYMARYIAKSLVAGGYADKIEIQIAYAIGVAEPISIAIDTFNTNKVSNDQILKLIYDNFDLRPGAIIKKFGLQGDVKFAPIAAYGHFGRDDLQLPWEESFKFT